MRKRKAVREVVGEVAIPGSVESVEEPGLTFPGRSLTQNPKTHEIDLTQRGYFDDVEPIPVDKRRRDHPEAAWTALEIKQLRSLIGKLAWPARETMPQIAFDVNEAYQKLAEPIVRRLLEANALLRKAKKIEKKPDSIKIP